MSNYPLIYFVDGPDNNMNRIVSWLLYSFIANKMNIEASYINFDNYSVGFDQLEKTITDEDLKIIVCSGSLLGYYKYLSKNPKKLTPIKNTISDAYTKTVAGNYHTNIFLIPESNKNKKESFLKEFDEGLIPTDGDVYLVEYKDGSVPKVVKDILFEQIGFM